MRTLADEILDALPRMLLAHPRGPAVKDISKLLYVPQPHAMVAARALDAEGRAIFLRYPGSKARHLVPLDFDLGGDRACAECRVTFTPPRRWSPKRCCSRKCAIAWSWNRPGVRERRSAAIRARYGTPEGQARIAALNERRWADPEQHEKLSQQNRENWADPAKAAKRAKAIQAAHGKPESRRRYADMRAAMWADPEYREKTVAGIRTSKRTPEARAKFSKFLRERWQDPEMREKYLAANRAQRAKNAANARGKKQSPEHIARRVASRKANKHLREGAPE